VKKVMIPRRNQKELMEIPAPVTRPLEIKLMDKFEDVIEEFFH